MIGVISCLASKWSAGMLLASAFGFFFFLFLIEKSARNTKFYVNGFEQVYIGMFLDFFSWKYKYEGT